MRSNPIHQGPASTSREEAPFTTPLKKQRRSINKDNQKSQRSCKQISTNISKSTISSYKTQPQERTSQMSSTKRLTEAYPIHRLGSPFSKKTKTIENCSPILNKNRKFHVNQNKVENIISKKLNFDSIPNSKPYGGPKIKTRIYTQLYNTEENPQNFQISSKVTLSPQKRQEFSHQIVFRNKRKIQCLANVQRKANPNITITPQKQYLYEKDSTKSQSNLFKRYQTEKSRSKIVGRFPGQRTSGSVELQDCLQKATDLKKQILELQSLVTSRVKMAQSRYTSTGSRRKSCDLKTNKESLGGLDGHRFNASTTLDNNIKGQPSPFELEYYLKFKN